MNQPPPSRSHHLTSPSHQRTNTTPPTIRLSQHPLFPRSDYLNIKRSHDPIPPSSPPPTITTNTPSDHIIPYQTMPYHTIAPCPIPYHSIPYFTKPYLSIPSQHHRISPGYEHCAVRYHFHALPPHCMQIYLPPIAPSRIRCTDKPPRPAKRVTKKNSDFFKANFMQ